MRTGTRLVILLVAALIQWPLVAQVTSTMLLPPPPPAPPAQTVPPQPPAPAPRLCVTPGEVVFPASGSQAVFTVLFEGKPLPSAEIDARIADEYGWMFTVRKDPKQPGTVFVDGHPGNTEKGTYYLLVKVRGEEVQARLVVTLSAEMPSMRPAVPEYSRITAVLALAPEYNEGQLVDLDLSGMGQSAWFSWRVNGGEVLEGVGESHLVHTLSTPGPVEIRVVAEQDGRRVLEWKGNTQVVAPAVHALDVRKNSELTLHAPDGFRVHEWRLDGALAGEGTKFVRTFTAAGEYRVECISREPERMRGIGYYRNEWKLTIR